MQINKIEETDKELRLHFEISKDYSEIIEKLSEEIKFNESTSAQKTLEILKSKLLSENSLRVKETRNSKFVEYISVIIGACMTVFLSIFIEQIKIPEVSISFESIFVIISIISSLAAIMVIYDYVHTHKE